MKRLLLATLASLGLIGIVFAAEIEDLDVVDAANTGRFPENQAPSSLNNGARALEAILARFYNDLGCRTPTAGSGVTYTLAASRAITSYYDGLLLCFDASFQNTGGSVTLNVDSNGAQSVRRNGASLVAGNIELGQKVLVVYDGTNFEVLSVMRAITTFGQLSGNADELLITDGTDATFRAITTYQATQAELEAGLVADAYTSPEKQHHHPSASKAWVSYEQIAPIGIRASYGVASVADIATGASTVTLTTAMSTTSYAILAAAGRGDNDADNDYVASIDTDPTATVIGIRVNDVSGTDTDVEFINVLILGDQ